MTLSPDYLTNRIARLTAARDRGTIAALEVHELDALLEIQAHRARLTAAQTADRLSGDVLADIEQAVASGDDEEEATDAIGPLEKILAAHGAEP